MDDEGRVRIFTGGDRVLQWAIRHWGEPEINSIDQLKPSTVFGVLVDGKPVAAVIFTEWRRGSFGNDMRITVVATNARWCQRKVLRELAHYAFDVANCVRLTSIVREGNARSVKVTVGLGFRKEGTIRRGFNGKTNALVFGMLKSECPWYEERVNVQGRLVGSAAA